MPLSSRDYIAGAPETFGNDKSLLKTFEELALIWQCPTARKSKPRMNST
jgi:hypothetical protein